MLVQVGYDATVWVADKWHFFSRSFVLVPIVSLFGVRLRGDVLGEDGRTGSAASSSLALKAGARADPRLRAQTAFTTASIHRHFALMAPRFDELAPAMPGNDAILMGTSLCVVPFLLPGTPGASMTRALDAWSTTGSLLQEFSTLRRQLELFFRNPEPCLLGLREMAAYRRLLWLALGVQNLQKEALTPGIPPPDDSKEPGYPARRPFAVAVERGIPRRVFWRGSHL